VIRVLAHGHADGALNPSPREPAVELRSLAVKQVVRVQKLRLLVTSYVLGMLVLTGVWIGVEYLASGGWPEHLSGNGRPGDWSPWIVWVALGWGFYVAVNGLAVHIRRHPAEADVERELERLKRRQRSWRGCSSRPRS